MFGSLGKRKERNQEVKKIAIGAIATMSAIVRTPAKGESRGFFDGLKQYCSKLLPLDGFKEKETNARIFLEAIVQLDSATEELVSRSYYSVIRQKPSTQNYYEAMRRLGFTKDDIFYIDNVRKVRNMCCHSYNMTDTFDYIFREPNKVAFFKKSIRHIAGVLEREYSLILSTKESSREQLAA